jgi:hypothetical protein
MDLSFHGLRIATGRWTEARTLSPDSISTGEVYLLCFLARDLVGMDGMERSKLPSACGGMTYFRQTRPFQIE